MQADPVLRAPIALALGSVQAFRGCFAEAVETLGEALRTVENVSPALRASLQAEFLNAAHWDSATRPEAGPVLAELERRFAEGESLDPRLHAYLAFSTLERGQSRMQALEHARLALEADPGKGLEMIAVRQVVTTLAVCGDLDRAELHCRNWLLGAELQGHVLAAALASSTMAIITLLGGRISDALAHARRSLAPPPEV